EVRSRGRQREGPTPHGGGVGENGAQCRNGVVLGGGRTEARDEDSEEDNGEHRKPPPDTGLATLPNGVRDATSLAHRGRTMGRTGPTVNGYVCYFHGSVCYF